MDPRTSEVYRAIRNQVIAPGRNVVYNSVMRKARNSRARLALDEYLTKTETTQTALADRLGVKQALISQWLNGKARPSARLREALETVCEIPAHHWLDASETAELARMAKAS